MRLIGITGKARAGKNEAASLLCNSYRYHEDSFAAPLRRFMMDILDIRSMNEYNSLKEESIPIFGGKTLREAIQTCGTEWGRDTIYSEIWIESLKNRIRKFGDSDRVVVSDIRFNNEAQAIHDLGGMILEIVRPNNNIESGKDHESESGIDPKFIYKTIYNDGTLLDFYQKIDDFIDGGYV